VGVDDRTRCERRSISYSHGNRPYALLLKWPYLSVSLRLSTYETVTAPEFPLALSEAEELRPTSGAAESQDWLDVLSDEISDQLKSEWTADVTKRGGQESEFKDFCVGSISV
jgi:hypothetical protein